MTIFELYDKIMEQFYGLPMATQEALGKKISIVKDPVPEVQLLPEGESPHPYIDKPEYRVIADYEGAKGEAYTETPFEFEGTLREAVEIKPTEAGIDARVIAAINAALCSWDFLPGTFPDDPEIHHKYAADLYNYVTRNMGYRSNVVLIGYDGYIVKKFVEGGMDFWTLDRNPSNISQNRFEHVVVNGAKLNREACYEWGQLFLLTGSTMTNGTVTHFLDREIKTLFYGITAAGPARLLGLHWFPTRPR